MLKMPLFPVPRLKYIIHLPCQQKSTIIVVKILYLLCKDSVHYPVLKTQKYHQTEQYPTLD
jgi:hypothetical protein